MTSAPFPGPQIPALVQNVLARIDLGHRADVTHNCLACFQLPLMVHWHNAPFFITRSTEHDANNMEHSTLKLHCEDKYSNRTGFSGQEHGSTPCS